MWNPKVKAIEALERGLQVLALVQKRGSISLHELHGETGIAKASLLRILVTLERRGLIWRRLADGHFCPGGAGASHRQNATLDRLAQAAAPALDDLQSRVLWPSDLTIRKGSVMTVCDTNRTHSYFTVRRDQLGFRISMLRSAVGRAYLAFCPQKERDTIIASLRRSQRPGDALARDEQALAGMLEATLRQGYGIRESAFGGGYDVQRRQQDDRLEAIAVPILSERGRVYGCVNIVWIQGVRTLAQMVDEHLPQLGDAARQIAARMRESP